TRDRGVEGRQALDARAGGGPPPRGEGGGGARVDRGGGRARRREGPPRAGEEGLSGIHFRAPERYKSATMDPRTRCKAVRSPRGAKVTEIEWGDGHRGVYPHAILRGYCPCAGCQGHTGTIRWIDPGSGGTKLELDQIE